MNNIAYIHTYTCMLRFLLENTTDDYVQFETVDGQARRYYDAGDLIETGYGDAPANVFSPNFCCEY